MYFNCVKQFLTQLNNCFYLILATTLMSEYLVTSFTNKSIYYVIVNNRGLIIMTTILQKIGGKNQCCILRGRRLKISSQNKFVFYTWKITNL